jgi:hypothetical protein
MVYFTEARDRPEDPIALDDAFEIEDNAPGNEKKVSRRVAHVHHG